MLNQPVTGTSIVQNYVYYCDNLAHNLFVKHEFDVNSTMVELTQLHRYLLSLLLLPLISSPLINAALVKKLPTVVFTRLWLRSACCWSTCWCHLAAFQFWPWWSRSANRLQSSQSFTATPVTGDVFVRPPPVTAQHLEWSSDPQGCSTRAFSSIPTSLTSVSLLQTLSLFFRFLVLLVRSSRLLIIRPMYLHQVTVFLEKTNAIVNLSAGTAGLATFGAIQSAYTNTSYSPGIYLLRPLLSANLLSTSPSTSTTSSLTRTFTISTSSVFLLLFAAFTCL